MNKIDDGGPAYPGLEYSSGYGNQKFDGVLPSGDSAWSTHAPGMTLRDWFAGQALAGMLAADGNDPRWIGRDTNPEYQIGGGKWIDPRGVAMQAYEIADSMIAHKRATEASRGSNNG